MNVNLIYDILKAPTLHPTKHKKCLIVKPGKAGRRELHRLAFLVKI